MVAHLSSKEPNSDRSASSMVPSTSSPPPQPMDVQTAGPPPFLNKTYEMVDDPSTDAIVSWNHGGNGFVVWNSNELQKQLLLKYFKHSNFSSFVRQLNTYGFRKVDPDRWEFANECFLKGQKHLLKGIHRRKPSTQQQQTQQAQAQPSKPACVEVGKFGVEGEIERLKRDKNVLMSELVRLRHHQQQTDQELSMVLQRLHVTEQRQQQMISFLAKAMQSPSFLAQLVQQNENKKRLATTRKKRRLPKQDGETDSGVEEGPSSPNEGQIVKYQPNSNDPMSIFMQYMNSPEMSAKVDLPNLEVSFRDLDSKQDGFMLTEMHQSRVMGDLSPSRLMNDLSESISAESDMQVAPTSPLSLMGFEKVDGGDAPAGSEGFAGGSGEVKDDEVNLGDAPTEEELLEWDQILGGSDIDFDVDGEASNQWWGDGNGHVDELAQQMRQL